MLVFFIDASNTFQTNVITNPSKRHYVGLPSLYLQWFASKWPDHPILKYHAKELAMQTLRQLQGTKDAGNKWYALLVKILTKLGYKVNSTCRGVWYSNKNGIRSIIALATDDMLFDTTDESAFYQLLAEFGRYFDYTVRTGMELSFLNFRVIQSPYGISIDQSTHIRQNILQKYFLPSDNIHNNIKSFST